MVKRHAHPDSRVSPCPDRVHNRRERLLRGLLGALPVCPMALLVFIDFFTEVQAPLPGAWSRLRGRSRRSPGLSPWQPPLAPISRRCLQARERDPDTLSELLPAAKPARAQTRCSKARSKDGNLLKGPWAGPKPHAAASLRPPGSHLIRLAGRHLELLSGRPGRDEDPAASG